MKRTLVILALLFCFLALPSMTRPLHAQAQYGLNLSQPIPVDSANKMIASYLASVHYPDSTAALRSLSFDAAALRSYLESDSTIIGVKLSLAHTLEYISNGGKDSNCGYQNGALTVIISAYDAFGNYKLIGSGQVMDYATPCPINCPPGEAASPYITD